MHRYSYSVAWIITNVQFRIQIKQFVLGLFAFNDDFNKFKTHLRDFLISLKEFAGDNADLYAEEREQALREARAAERDRAMRVGGLLKPSEMDQDDELWLEEELRTEFIASTSPEAADCPRISNPFSSRDWMDGWTVYGLWTWVKASFTSFLDKSGRECHIFEWIVWSVFSFQFLRNPGSVYFEMDGGAVAYRGGSTRVFPR